MLHEVSFSCNLIYVVPNVLVLFYYYLVHRHLRQEDNVDEQLGQVSATVVQGWKEYEKKWKNEFLFKSKTC